MSAPGTLKSHLKRSRALTIAGRSTLHLTSRIRERIGPDRGTIGATHRGLGLEQSLSYVNAVYDDYLAYAGLNVEKLAGARVLEVGAGDNFGVALRLLGAGAERVVAVDRFVTWRDPEQQRAIYTALLEAMEPVERERAAAAVVLDGEPRFDERRLEVLEGIPIEEAPARLGPESFSLILSRAVMEHVGNVRGSFEAMDRLLVPGGTMAHKVDLSDHGLFTPGGHPPLTFLTVADRQYRWMGGDAGLPNRVPADVYRSELERLGYEPTVLVTHLIDSPEELVPHPAEPPAGRLGAAGTMVEEIRPRLLPRYRALPASTLAVAGIFLIARKPAERR